MMLFKKIAVRVLVVLALVALTIGCRTIALEDTFDPGGTPAPATTVPGDTQPDDTQPGGGQTDATQPGGGAAEGGQPGGATEGGAVEQPGSAEGGQPDAGAETPGGETPPPAGGEGDAGVDAATPPAQDTGAGAPTGRIIHTIQAGETIGRIAEAYGVSIDAIAQVNNLENVNRITAGDTLEIPTPAEAAAIDAAVPPPTPTPEPIAGFDPNRFVNHTVRAGETLYIIGRAYGFTVEELAAFNNLADPRLIYGGQVLKIPVR